MAGRKMHQRFGKLPWKDLFASAIAYAEQGFPVTEAIQEAWTCQYRSNAWQATPNRRASFCPAAKRREQGDVFRNPDMARAYRTARRQGPRRFLQRRDRRRHSQDFASAWAAP